MAVELFYKDIPDENFLRLLKAIREEPLLRRKMKRPADFISKKSPGKSQKTLSAGGQVALSWDEGDFNLTCSNA